MTARLMLAVVPLVLVAAGYGVFRWLRPDAATDALKYGATYEVWISEAEVTPVKPDGKSWDLDGSAPDLRGAIIWQGLRIFETVADSNGLIARWEPLGLRLSAMLRGEMDASTVRRVGRARPDEKGFIEVEVFDVDAVGADWVGGFRAPWSVLRPGVNELRDEGPLLRLCITVVEPGASRVEMPLHAVRGAEKLSQPSAAAKGMISNVASEVGSQVEDATQSALDKAGGLIKEGFEWIKPGKKEQ